MSESRSKKESEQRERMEARFGNRPKSQPTADFDLPAPNDNIEGSAMSDKPVYQAIINGKYEDVSEKRYAELKATRAMTRILYQSAAYEALKAKVECLEGQIELEQAKFRGEEETVKRVVAHSEALKAENEAQAKRIAELEQNSRDFTELCKVNDEAIAGYIAKIKELEEALGADPKVIAAAPDLLEALCDMVSDHEYLSSKTIESAKKALEKALGVEAYWRCELLTEDEKQND